MVPKTKKFCTRCGVERPMDLFPMQGKFHARICIMHDGQIIPDELQELVQQERKLWCSPDAVKQLQRKKRRAERKRIRRIKRQGYVPVVHERQLKRRRVAAARVALRPEHMTRKGYAAYLESAHWREFTQSYRANPETLHECFVCGDHNYELHHHTYIRIGEELVQDVVPLCCAHHRAVHNAVKSGVQLAAAHTYVKMRFSRGELGLRNRSLKDE